VPGRNGHSGRMDSGMRGFGGTQLSEGRCGGGGVEEMRGLD